MLRTFILTIALALMTLAASVSFAAPCPGTPTIELAKEVHFLTPEGEDVVVAAGTYGVEVTDGNDLQLVPEGGDKAEAVQLGAMGMTLEEELPETSAHLHVYEDQDTVHLGVLTAEGEGFWALGTLSGVRTRHGSVSSSWGEYRVYGNWSYFHGTNAGKVIYSGKCPSTHPVAKRGGHICRDKSAAAETEQCQFMTAAFGVTVPCPDAEKIVCDAVQVTSSGKATGTSWWSGTEWEAWKMTFTGAGTYTEVKVDAHCVKQ